MGRAVLGQACSWRDGSSSPLMQTKMARSAMPNSQRASLNGSAIGITTEAESFRTNNCETGLTATWRLISAGLLAGLVSVLLRKSNSQYSTNGPSLNSGRHSQPELALGGGSKIGGKAQRN